MITYLMSELVPGALEGSMEPSRAYFLTEKVDYGY